MARLSLLRLVLLAFASCQPEARYASATGGYHTGDNRRWAARSYDDSHWAAERGPTGQQVFWVRSWATFRPGDYAPPLGLAIRAFGAFEVYWDGILIGNNGQPATGTQPAAPRPAAACSATCRERVAQIRCASGVVASKWRLAARPRPVWPPVIRTEWFMRQHFKDEAKVPSRKKALLNIW